MTKTEIIGTPIKIGNLEVDHYDFPEEMDWNTAIKSCLNLGDGRRLPTKEELNILFKNKETIGGFARLDYWSSTEGQNLELAWYQNFFKGKNATFKHFKCRVRAVRSLEF